MSVDIIIDPWSVDDCCRLCKGYLRVKGILTNTKKIFDSDKITHEKSVYERLIALGLTLSRDKSRSDRICRSCFRLLRRIEDDFPILRRWQEAEQETNPEASTSTGFSRDLDVISRVQLPRKSIDGSFCRIVPAVRHVGCQTEPTDRRSVDTQLQNNFRSTATQVKVPSRDCGVCTLTFPLDSPLLLLQPTTVQRPSKRPRLSLTDEEEGPSECNLSKVVQEPDDST